MGSKLTLRNNLDNEFTIEHQDGLQNKLIKSNDIAVAVDGIDDLPSVANTGDVVIVRDMNRGGTFVYDDTKSAENNGGTIFDGWVRQYSGAVNVKWFGAVGDGVTDDTLALENAVNIEDYSSFELKNGDTYAINTLQNLNNGRIFDGQNANLLKAFTGAALWVRWREGCSYKNITCIGSKNTIGGIEQQRTAVSSNVRLENVKVFDNYDSAEVTNAWGFYFKDVSNSTLINCSASGNSTQDFSFVDNVHNVTVVNPTDGGHGEGCIFAFEPNPEQGGINGVSVTGGVLSRLLFIEYDNAGISTRNVSFTGTHIGELFYRGSDVSLNQCKIDSYGDATASDNTIGAGELKSDSIYLGENLLVDEHVTSISRTDTSSYWRMAGNIGDNDKAERVLLGDRPVLRINPNKISSYSFADTRSFIDTEDSPYILSVYSSTDATGTGTNNFYSCGIRFYDASDVLIKTIVPKTNRAPIDTISQLGVDSAIIIPPVGAVKCKVFVGYEATRSASVDVYSVSLRKIQENSGTTLNEVNAAMKKYNGLYKRTTPISGGLTYFVGETIVNPSPAGGSHIGSVVVTTGRPATWKTFGAITA
jgi:hypothetical protein